MNDDRDPPSADAGAIPEGARRLAWDGIALVVPANWELANFRMRRREVSRIELEDEYAVRLEAEWVRTDAKTSLDGIMTRYRKAARHLTVKAEQQAAVEGLPNGWKATHFVFKETGTDPETDLHVVRHELVTAFYLCPGGTLFGFFLIHVLPEDSDDPVALMRMLAAGFKDHHRSERVPWQLFDICFATPRAFELTETAFDIGAKRMVFTWKRRRLFLWFFSCADMLLKDGIEPSVWSVGYLNGWGGIRGIVFRAEAEGRIAWRRSWVHPFGHRDETFRWCFRYDVGYRLDNESNQLLVWVYHYRKPSDLEMVWELTRCVAGADAGGRPGDS